MATEANIVELQVKPVRAEAELAAAMALVRRVFGEYVAPGYSQEGIAFFHDFIAEDAMRERIRRGEIEIWGAECKGELAGVIAMRPPRAVSLLFVDKQHHRQGIAGQLLRHALANFPGDGSPATVHASPYSVEAYRKLGFTETGPEEVSSGLRFSPMILTGQA